MEYGDPDSSSGGCSKTQLPACPVGTNAHVVRISQFESLTQLSSICSKDVECSPASPDRRSLSAAMVWSARRIAEGASSASSWLAPFEQSVLAVLEPLHV